MSEGRLREAGDAALLFELEPVIDARVNARAIAVADALRRRRPAGLRDVRSTYRSVALYFDPLVSGVPALRAALAEALATAPPAPEGPLVEVPVSYGGEHGPDLAAVASAGGLSEEEAIARHVEPTYRVFMIGFLPGFPYMGPVDASIAAPRRATPRARVPAGSVGIAGTQTGIYPCDSPGGWQIVGRTGLQMFEAARPSPALLAAGDHVRFVRDGGLAASRPRPAAGGEAPPRHTAAAGRSGVTVLRPGLMTTVQDEGRWGFQHLGVPVSGAMDLASHRLANALAGNDPRAATLEATVTGPELRLDGSTAVAIAGGDLGATLDGRALPPGACAVARPGSVLRFAGRRAGGRAYVAFGGGLDVAETFGSRATHPRTATGGFGGRSLRAGDHVPIGPWSGSRPVRSGAAPPLPAGGARLRVLPGPQDDFFPPDALQVLESTRFTITPESDRMGYRLAADRAIPRLPGREMISDATFAGAIQVPPSGRPILLMADRQTTGGYPQIAVVITADLPSAGQLLPGDWVEFACCSRDEAIAALAAAGAAR